MSKNLTTVEIIECELDTLYTERDLYFSQVNTLEAKNAKLEKCLRLFAFPEGTLEHEAVERAARQCLKAINED